MDKEFNLIAAIRILLKWKTPILVVTLAAGVLAAVFAFFVMDEYFLSWSTFYPTNQYLTDRNMIFNSEANAGQVDYFGTKADVNRVMTISNSEPILNYVIDSFKIAEHYKIDKSEKYWQTKVRKKFDKNYEAVKTEKDAVEISLFDTDPELAAKVVNAVVAKVDELNKEHVKKSKEDLYNVLSAQIDEQQKKVNHYVDTLAALASLYNIKVASASGSTVLVEGNNFKAVQQYKALLENQENSLKELNNRINIKEQMEVAMKSNPSSLFIVERAFKADRKEKPVRSLVILLTMLITFFVSILGAFLFEQIQDIRKQLAA